MTPTHILYTITDASLYSDFYEELGKKYPETELVHKDRGVATRYWTILQKLTLSGRINQLTDLFIDLSKSEKRIQHRSVRKGEVKDSYADISKANRMLKYRPKTNLATGTREFLEWCQSRFMKKGSF
jgi:nucleoside-diphosphate-sugar epimerase